jgi:PTS system nitrogen regulatory IIA component
MELSDLLTPERVIADLAVPDKPALLAELGRRASSLVGIPAARITLALENRERLGSTGLGGGFALPHTRLDGLEKFFGMFVRLARPIPFDAIDDLPVSLVFLLLSPAEAGSDHLAALAAISRRIGDPDVARRLRSLSSVAELFTTLTGVNGKQAA